MEDLKILEQKCEDAHQKLLSIDNQYYHIQKLYESEQQKIASLQQFKIDLDKSTSELSLKKENLVTEVNQLIKTRDEVTSVLEETRSALTQASADLEAEYTERDDLVIVMGEREEALVTRETQMAEREKQVKRSEEIAQEAHNKIKAFKETI